MEGLERARRVTAGGEGRRGVKLTIAAAVVTKMLDMI